MKQQTSVANERKTGISLHSLHADSRSRSGSSLNHIPHLLCKMSCPCDGGCPRCQSSLPLQAKLTIGRPDDVYEQEADRVADEVMDLPDFVIQAEHSARRISPFVQKKSARAEEATQGSSVKEAALEVTPAIHSGITTLRGGGRPLTLKERDFFEPRFRTDFSDVRIHDDAKAADMARSMNARAFTLGRDIVFGAGRYSPHTAAGQTLTAHELTHVVQQRKTTERPTEIRCGFIDNFWARLNALPATIERRAERAWQDAGSERIVHFWCDFTYTLLDEEVSAFEEAVSRRGSIAGTNTDIFATITSQAPRLVLRQGLHDSAFAVAGIEQQISQHDWEIVGATIDTAKCRVWHDRPRSANFGNIGCLFTVENGPSMVARPLIVRWNLANINQARTNYINAMIREIPTMQAGPTPFQKELARLALTVFQVRDHPQNLVYVLPGHPIAGQSVEQWGRIRLNHMRVPPGLIEQVLGESTPGFLVGSGM